MIPEPYKTALLIFVAILDIIVFSRSLDKRDWVNALVYLVLSSVFCYLLAVAILK